MRHAAMMLSLRDSRYSGMGDFRKLAVFEKAHLVAVGVHQIAKSIRDTRYIPLRNQMIRAAESVPTNIVEGSRKRSDRDFARFLDYAANSASELEYLLMLSSEIGATPQSEVLGLIDQVIEVRKMLHGLIRRLKKTAE